MVRWFESSSRNGVGRFAGDKNRALGSGERFQQRVRLGEWSSLFIEQRFAPGEIQTRRCKSLLQENRLCQSAGVLTGGAQRLKVNTQKRKAEFMADSFRRQATTGTVASAQN